MIRPDLHILAPYAHAVDAALLPQHARLGRTVRLGSNENPLGPSPLAVEAMARAASVAGRYPQADSSRCIRAIAEHLGVPAEHILMGNGGDEIIDLLVRVLAVPGRDAVLTCRPCFDVYRTQALVCGARLEQVPLQEDFALPLEALADKAGADTAVVFVTTPDNPSGLTTPPRDLERLARALPPRTFLLVDEAYVDFADAPGAATCLPLPRTLPNVGILRTFSKAYGLAGARLGYGVLPLPVADICRRAQIPFSVNLFAQEGGIAALADQEHYRRTVALVREQRAVLRQGLLALGCRVPDSQSNFLMFHPPCSSQELFTGLLRQGILIRNLKPNGLDGWLRVSVGTPEECAAFLEAVASLVPVLPG